MMNTKQFYLVYIPALEEALKNDNINHGYSVYGPEFYIPEEYQNAVDAYIESANENRFFLDCIGYYFDAKSHNFSNVQGVDIEEYKVNIQNEIDKIKGILM